MIYLIQNDREYDYDVRAIALAFYERTKIVEVTKEEFEEQEWEKDDLLLTLVYTKKRETGNEVKEQYRQVVGQNGIPIYRLYSFSNGRDSNNTFSLCATLRQRFAFCGSARYVSRKRCSSFAESFSSSIHFIIIFVGRIPVSIPHGRLLPVYFSNKRYKKRHTALRLPL